MPGEVIRLGDHTTRRTEPKRGRSAAESGNGVSDATGPTGRITPRSGRPRWGRQPVIPSPEELAAGDLAARYRSYDGQEDPLEAEPADAEGLPGVPTLKAVQDPPPETPAGAGPDEWDERVAALLAFLRHRLTGEYDVDEFGFDPELSDHVLLPMLRLLYRHWFRVEVTGIENVPADGSALLVANHSGVIALDALMLTVAVRDDHPAGRHLRQLGANFVFSTPLLAELARKSGATLACHPDAERLLRTGEVVAVFPEGFKGVGKPFSERYKLQRFGRGGFVSAALRTGAPIIPVSIVGAEETYPLIGDIKPLARLLGLPYFPVTPLFPWLGPLGAIPLPSKWLIEFGEPIQTADLDANPDDPLVVFNLADQVREAIQQTLYQVLLRRNGVFG
ncbi:MAG: lysophospholipid acyltransferase family protein [Micromonosporaceae bacterium]